MSAQNQLPNLDKIFRDDDESDFVPSGGCVLIYTTSYKTLRSIHLLIKSQ